MKKAMLIVGIFLLIILKLMGAGSAEQMERWVFNPRVSVEVVDRVDDEGRYSVYYCIDSEIVITLRRDVLHDTGLITMQRGDINSSHLLYEKEWENAEDTKRTINELIEKALNSSE